MMNNILAKAPQCHAQLPKRAVRALALVAFSVLGSALSFAADQVELVHGQWQPLYIALDNIQKDAGSAADYLSTTMSKVSSLDFQQLKTYDLLYRFCPNVQSAIVENGTKIDATNDKLQKIVDGLATESISGDVQAIKEDLHSVIVDGPAPSLRVSFDPRISVTNKLEFSADLTNALAKIGNSTFNTNYNPQLYNSPIEGRDYIVLWSSAYTADQARKVRVLGTLSMPKLTGDFLTDSVALLRVNANIARSISTGNIRTVLVLDGATNRLEVLQQDLYGFHNANTNLLSEIKDQDRTHHESFEELKTAVLAWLDSQEKGGAAAESEAEELLGEVRGFQPEAGTAPQQSFRDEDLSSRIESFNSLISVLQSRDCPQKLVIHYGGWHLFGAKIEDDPIEISLQSARGVFDALRTGFSLLWWGLSALVMWWIVRLLVQLHHKIITWTFTTTSGPQSS